MNSFYSDTAVRQRLVEFLGGDSLDHATAVCLTHSDGCQFDRRELRPTGELNWFLDNELDIARSLADSKTYLLHLDMEYVNFDSPAEAYVDPWRCFELQEPVVKVVESLLLEWGIQPLHVVTGQGHHFVWQIGKASEIVKRIRALIPAPELTYLCMDRVPSILKQSIDASDQNIFSAISLLFEYMAHRIKELASPLSFLPVEITAVHVGPCVTTQREMISIDISEYGDPLHTRVIRMPFTNYRKPWVTGLARKLGIEHKISTFRSIPLYEMDFRQAIKARQLEEDVLDLARRACVRIPFQEEGTNRLMDEYLGSRLRRFHEFFYSTQHDPKESWPHTYGRTPLNTLPACVRHLLEFPNDLLLKPAGIQMVTRAMLGQDWHPRHIAGLIRSKFENPIYGWGIRWEDYEAGTRADFYTRLFSGLLATGLDRLVDFNCTSIREKGFCFQQEDTSCNLEPARQKLLTNPLL